MTNKGMSFHFCHLPRSFVTPSLVPSSALAAVEPNATIALGLITINSLTAADSLIIPVQCEYFALEGLGKLLNTIKIIQTRLNPNLEIEGILLTLYDSRTSLGNQVVEEVRTHFKSIAFKTIVPRNVKLSESPSFGLPVIVHDAESKGAISYLNLAHEILDKNGMSK